MGKCYYLISMITKDFSIFYYISSSQKLDPRQFNISYNKPTGI